MRVSVPSSSSSSLLWLTLWFLTFQAAHSVVTRSHFCSARTSKKIYEDHMCSDLMDLLTVRGYHFERFKPESAPTFKHPGAVCTFSKLEVPSGQECCPGWDGVRCDVGVCDGGCAHGRCGDAGGPVSAPAQCLCDAPYTGKRCEEDSSKLTEELQFCYTGNTCHGTILGEGDAMSISRCCEELGGTTWGSQDQAYGCTPCSPGDTPECFQKEKPMKGIMPIALGISVLPLKDVIIETEAAIYTLSGTTLTVKDGSDTATFDVSKLANNKPTAVNNKGTVNVKYESAHGAVYLSLEAFDVDVRTDLDGTFMLTVRQDSPLKASLEGVCGNMDGDYADELALLTTVGAQKVFEKFKKDSIPCGTGVEDCPSDMADQATEACSALSTSFSECHKAVSMNEFLERCRKYYCASMSAPGGGPGAAQKAVCNVLSSYSTVCMMVTGKATLWRTQQLCPKQCPPPYVFTGNMLRKCPITCGVSPVTYTRPECQSSLPFAGCECPQGKARLNDTCVAPGDCQCVAENGRFYHNGAAIVSGDHCHSWYLDRLLNNHRYLQVTENTKTFNRDLKHPHCVSLRGSNIDIKMETATCTQTPSGEHVCPTFVSVTYNGKTSTIDVSVSGVNIVNGFSPTIYIRQVSKNIWALDIKGGKVRILIRRDGTVHLKMKTSVYKNNVVGLCGTMDNNRDNDFTTYSQAVVNGQSFLEVFTGCSSINFTQISPVPMNPVCQQLLTAPVPANARVNTDSYVKMCNNAEDDKLRCSILQSFALATYNDFQQIFPGEQVCSKLLSLNFLASMVTLDHPIRTGYGEVLPRDSLERRV
ncbi:von Willebrand factor [Elysia marginata]|uniref:von Willebrand factor n=1 Tax=Elysia marginata TaxID=1093978 RepID=A0AAV4HF30_9GAST|nr:von Willebrand factor [Elysia marginata]